MPPYTPYREETQTNRLADVLDRLAGALEHQARGLEDLKADVRALGESLKRVESRLDGLERASPAVSSSGNVAPAAAPAKPAGKKRGK